jgi:signal transduction histidine kinase/CheY-like chemotaxis protein
MRELRTVGMSETAMRVIQVCRDGVERLVEGTVSPIFDSGGKFAGAVLVFRDVTEKVRADNELMKRKELESLGILAGGIAHDFNNFLSGILGNISLAKLTVDTENKAYTRLEGAEKASIGAKALATKLLAFAKGGKPLRKPMSLESVLRDSSGFAVMGSNCRCEFHIPKGLWPVVADTAQIGQVIGNLVINAVHAMSGGGTIRIHAENATVCEGDVQYVKAGDFVKVEVVDQGAGIPKENQQKIFDPYFTTKERGTGLGLATSYAIMKGHGGNIFVESEPGAGTTFRLYLPAARGQVLPEGKSGPGTIIKGSGRVLVMDDEELILDVVAGILDHLGYEPFSAKDGAEAIEKYAKAVDSGEPFNAVIMDLTIPGGMGGKEAAAKLLGLYPGAKLIVSSGYSDDPVMAEFAKYGFRGFVAKPCRIEELSRVLHEVILGRTEQQV